MDAIQISRTGLDVEWQRLQVIAQNLANMNTSSATESGGYHAVRLLSGPQSNFAQRLSNQPGGVEVVGLKPVGGAGRRVYEPEHPHADSQGFVTYPAVNHASEMTLLIQTSRAYEANLTALSIAQQMYSRAAELGKQA